MMEKCKEEKYKKLQKTFRPDMYDRFILDVIFNDSQSWTYEFDNLKMQIYLRFVRGMKCLIFKIDKKDVILKVTDVMRHDYTWLLDKLYSSLFDVIQISDNTIQLCLF